MPSFYIFTKKRHRWRYASDHDTHDEQAARAAYAKIQLAGSIRFKCLIKVDDDGQKLMLECDGDHKDGSTVLDVPPGE
jgi:hypothetical protein